MKIWAKGLAMYVPQVIQHQSVTRHVSLILIIPFLTFCLLLITFLQQRIFFENLRFEPERHQSRPNTKSWRIVNSIPKSLLTLALTVISLSRQSKGNASSHPIKFHLSFSCFFIGKLHMHPVGLEGLNPRPHPPSHYYGRRKCQLSYCSLAGLSFSL